MFLVNSRLGRFAAAPIFQGAPLLPKLRGEIAEFLNGSSLARLRIFLLAYLCRFAVRSDTVSLEAFLGPFAPRFAWDESRTSSWRLASRERDFPLSHKALRTQDDQRLGRSWLERPPFAQTTVSGDGIFTVCPSPTAIAFGLGPANLQRTNLPEEP